jgi:hypothetical protein
MEIGARLQDWLTVDRFQAALDAAIEEFGPATVITPSLKWFGDAYCAAAFARRAVAPFAVETLRLVPQTDYGADFEVMHQTGQVSTFQVVEADSENRRRGDEYRQWEDGAFAVRHDPDWDKEAHSISRELQRVARKKVKKPYPPEMHLLIYLNLPWLEEMQGVLPEHTQDASGKFRSTWVLWGQHLHRCWPDQWRG